MVVAVLVLSSIGSASPKRIVSTMPSITEMLYLLDLQDKVVGVTTNCNFPPAAAQKPKIGAFFVNLESLAALKPDLVVMLKGAQDKDISKVKRFGLSVYELDIKSVNDILDAMIELSVLAGEPDRGREVVRTLRNRLAAVEERTKNYRPALNEVLKVWGGERRQRQALVIIGLEPLVAAGGGTYIDDILRLAGVENIAAKAKVAYPQYSFERLIRENPEYLIIPKQLITPDQLATSKRWQSLEAARRNRVLFIDQDIISRPGPRVVDAVEQIADFIY